MRLYRGGAAHEKQPLVGPEDLRSPAEARTIRHRGLLKRRVHDLRADAPVLRLHGNGAGGYRGAVEVRAADAGRRRQKRVEYLARFEERRPRRVELAIPFAYAVDVEPRAHDVRKRHPGLRQKPLRLAEHRRRLLAARRRKIGRKHSGKQTVIRKTVLPRPAGHAPSAHERTRHPTPLASDVERRRHARQTSGRIDKPERRRILSHARRHLSGSSPDKFRCFAHASIKPVRRQKVVTGQSRFTARPHPASCS